MPGGPLTMPARPALFGKLPAHGDFVRRGDPATVRWLDGWLTAEVERLATARGDALDVALEGLPFWAFVLADGRAGALAGSHDRVGRVFPVACCAGEGRAAAAHAAAVLGRAIGELLDADAVAAALGDVPVEDEDEEAPPAADGARWWRPLDADARAFAVPGLAAGADFDRLFEGGL